MDNNFLNINAHSLLKSESELDSNTSSVSKDTSSNFIKSTMEDKLELEAKCKVVESQEKNTLRDDLLNNFNDERSIFSESFDTCFAVYEMINRISTLSENCSCRAFNRDTILYIKNIA